MGYFTHSLDLSYRETVRNVFEIQTICPLHERGPSSFDAACLVCMQGAKFAMTDEYVFCHLIEGLGSTEPNMFYFYFFCHFNILTILTIYCHCIASMLNSIVSENFLKTMQTLFPGSCTSCLLYK